MSPPRTPDRDSHDEDLETGFARLLKVYRSRLKRDIDALAELLQQARSARPALEPAYLLAHRLKGTSGTYGLQQCSTAFERIEMRLSELMNEPPDPSDAWHEIGISLERARCGLEGDPPVEP